MNTLHKYLGAITLTLGLAACGSNNNSGSHNPDPAPPSVGTVVDVAVANGNFTTLVAALEATGLDTVLDDPEASFTVFAPTDDAFALLGEETIAGLLADTDTLTDILLYHVVSGAEIDSTTAVGAAGTTLEMANGSNVGLSLSGSSLMVNLSMVTLTDVEADNGVIHVIDAVLIPPAARGEPTASIVDIAVDNENFSTLVAALQAADLDAVLADEDSTFTVFAPTNAAFAALGEDNLNALLNDPEALRAVLLQHVVAGAEVNSIAAYAASGTSVATAGGVEVPVSIENRVLRVGGAAVTSADIYATNGVIHVIDTVITGAVDLPAPPMSIVDVASSAGNFSTLIAALEATGLDATLADMDGTFTVFAPTDAAFAKLGDAAINELLADPDTLSNILSYHVIAGSQVLANSAIAIAQSDNSLVEMANGSEAALSLSGDSLLVNLSTVTDTNVLAGNGVIHVLDTVLIPPAEKGDPQANIVETAIANGNFTTLVAALQAADLDTVLADESAVFTVFAPTDAAFAKIDEAVLNDLIANVPALTKVLLQHVVVGAEVNSVNAFALNGTAVDTAAEEDVDIAIVDGKLQIQGADVVMFDVYTSNGVIHVIDTVITETLE